MPSDKSSKPQSRRRRSRRPHPLTPSPSPRKEHSPDPRAKPGTSVGGGKLQQQSEKARPRRRKNGPRRGAPQQARRPKLGARIRKQAAGSRELAAGSRKAWVYIDGFNLYYGAVKGTPYRWLDVRKMCELLLPDLKVEKIKYFTARVSGRMADPGQPTRQQIYLRALRTLAGLEIILGSFLAHDVMMPLANPVPGGQKFALVVKTEEKGSDVNIASHMIGDAHRKSFDVAVLVSNDSDLLAPVRIVRHEMGIPVGILNPHRYTPSRTLMPFATFVKMIREGVLAASQLPPKLKDTKGEIRKPEKW